MRIVIALLASGSLAGCATTSFAPPSVDIGHDMADQTLSTECLPTGTRGTKIDPDVEGAQKLIDNFIMSYRCTIRAAADGRQPFEILGFLTLVGSTAAVALGAGPKVAIAGGIGNSVFTAGEKYYDPKEQTSILADALDALACIKTESVGISPFDLAATANQQRTALAGTGPTVTVTPERQYFNLVAGALLSVERAATIRLSRRGSFDSAGVAAEIETLTKKIEDAEKAKKNLKPQDPAVSRAVGRQIAAAMRVADLTQLELDVLQPKLQKCVVRAKS
jgi:transposase